jgi:hypothetical protein
MAVRALVKAAIPHISEARILIGLDRLVPLGEIMVPTRLRIKALKPMVEMKILIRRSGILSGVETLADSIIEMPHSGQLPSGDKPRKL